MRATLMQQSRWGLSVAAIIAGLIVCYWDSVSLLVGQWLSNDDFSHGLLIVPISLYLAWERRHKLAQTSMTIDWRAIALLLMAIVIYIVGELGAELFTTRVSLLVFFIGALWFLFGPGMMKVLAFPLAFLFLMLPLPSFVYRNLTFPLQLLSSKWAVAFLDLCGVMAYREGNVIDLGFTRFQVVEACNGLRFILPLFTLGVLFAFWRPKRWWERLVLVAATIPIAMGANILRIGGTGVLARYWGPEVAEGFFHGFSGWAVFMLSFVAFFLLNRLLAIIPRTESGQRQDAGCQDGIPPRRPRLVYVVVPLAFIVATPFIVGALGNVAPRKLQQPLAHFPLAFQGYAGKRGTIEAKIWKQVGGQDYFMADYVRSGSAPINFYTAFYEYQRKAGDFVHSPRLCLPGAGWYFEVNHTREIVLSGQTGEDPVTLRLNELVIRKGEHRQVLYFWYQGRDRNFTSEYAAKFWMVWDGIWRRRTDGALVRLTAALAPGQRVDAVRGEMDRFAVAAYRELNHFLP